MIVGKILIKNGFYNSDSDCFLFSCELMFGNLTEGNKMIVDKKSKYLINNVETPVKDFPGNKIISIKKNEFIEINISSLYNSDFFLED